MPSGKEEEVFDQLKRSELMKNLRDIHIPKKITNIIKTMATL